MRQHLFLTGLIGELAPVCPYCDVDEHRRGDEELKIVAEAMEKITTQDGQASRLTEPMMQPHRQKDFEDLEASELFCPACQRAMPVRKRLFLVLLDKEIYNYLCTGCGSALGKKEQPWRGPDQRSRT